ncbi:MAG: hypothetical protein M1814_005856 [Vezdaea aestivalis]|nr:MAG: hypothetical protein M1814_005856 [Vezdaea aestivalis]
MSDLPTVSEIEATSTPISVSHSNPKDDGFGSLTHEQSAFIVWRDSIECSNDLPRTYRAQFSIVRDAAYFRSFLNACRTDPDRYQSLFAEVQRGGFSWTTSKKVAKDLRLVDARHRLRAKRDEWRERIGHPRSKSNAKSRNKSRASSVSSLVTASKRVKSASSKLSEVLHSVTLDGLDF